MKKLSENWVKTVKRVVNETHIIFLKIWNIFKRNRLLLDYTSNLKNASFLKFLSNKIT